MSHQLLILGGRDSSVHAAKQFDTEVVMFQHKAHVTDFQRQHCAHYEVIPHEDQKQILERAKEYHQKRHFDAVVSFNESWLVRAGEVSDALKIKGNSSKAVKISRDKRLFRECLNKKGISVVPFKSCRSYEDILSFIKQVNGPIVIKPSKGASSAGISIIRNIEEINNAIDWLSNSPDWMKGEEPILAEAYIDGKEYSVETITHEGKHTLIGITQKVNNAPPHFIEIGHFLPAINISNSLKKSIEDTVDKALTAIDQQVGPAHTEIRVQNDTPYIIETQTRFGGGQLYEMVKFVYGIDFPAQTIASLLQLNSPKFEPKYTATAFRGIFLPPGRVEQILGLKDLEKDPRVIRVNLVHQVGDVVPALKTSQDSSGYVFTNGKDSIDALENAHHAMSKLSFCIDGRWISGKEIAMNPVPILHETSHSVYSFSEI